MPCGDFSEADIVAICSDIARRDNILVQNPPKKKKKPFRGFNISERSLKPKQSSITRRLSLINGIPSILDKNSADKEQTYVSVDSTTQSMKDQQRSGSSQNIPGLHGRDIIAMAIFVNSDGVRTFTEDQKISSDEVDAADKIFLTRVPVQSCNTQNQNGSENSASFQSNNSDAEGDLKPLADCLENMNSKQIQKLMKNLDKQLMRLHTTDLNTALSFLKVERYVEVRSDIKTELLTFASKELKLVIV